MRILQMQEGEIALGAVSVSKVGRHMDLFALSANKYVNELVPSAI